MPVTLELVMIVKNAENVIRKTIETVLPIINYYTIIDTGSTDSTLEILHNILDNSGITGTIYTESFVDFSTTRNRAFELAGTRADYHLMLDDSFIVVNPTKLLNYIKLGCDMYFIGVNTSNLIYKSNRILKSNKQYRYKFKIHELIEPSNKDNVYNIDKNECFIHDDKNVLSILRTRARMNTDIKWLEEELKETNGVYPRTFYYLGMLYDSMDDRERSYSYLTKCISLGKTDQYTFLACMGLANVMLRRRDDWNCIFNVYRKAVAIDPECPTPYYEIGNYLYRNGSIDEAHVYLTKAYNCTPTIEQYVDIEMVKFKIPYLLTEIYLKKGKPKKAKQLLNQHLTDRIEGRKILDYLSLADGDISVKRSHRKIIVINTADVVEWDPAEIYKKASGSEYMAYNLAVQFTNKNWGVYVFGLFSKNEQIIDGITYYSIEQYEQFIKTRYIDVLVVLRDPKFIYYYPNIPQVYLWLHDTSMVSDSFQVHPEYFKGIICLTEWHKKFIQDCYYIPDNLIHVIGNSIDPSRFEISVPKIPNRFIYTSSYDRGLDILLDMWPIVKQRYSDAELVVFTSLPKESVMYNMKLEGVVFKQRVDQKQLAVEIKKSDVWFYPTTFSETYCITALEMQAGRVLCVCPQLAALKETVGNRGVSTNGNMFYEKDRMELLDKMFKVMETPKLKNYLLTAAEKWSKTQSLIQFGNAFESLVAKH